MNEVRRNPKLALCTSESFIGAVLIASQTGLEIGPFGYAYLIPRKNGRTKEMEVNFQLGYRGAMQLAWNSSKVGGITAAAVCENDEFDYALGADPFIKHVPTEAAPGKITHFYAVAKNLQSGEYQFKVMPKWEVDLVRDQYAQGTDNAASPWQTSYDAMGMKTCIIRLCKMMPMSSEAQRLITMDESIDVGAPQNLAGELPADFQDLDNLIPTQGQVSQEETDNKIDGLRQRLEAESKEKVQGEGEPLSETDAGESPKDPEQSPQGLKSPASTLADFDLMEIDMLALWLLEHKRPGNGADTKSINSAVKLGDKAMLVTLCKTFAKR